MDTSVEINDLLEKASMLFTEANRVMEEAAELLKYANDLKLED